MSASFYVRCECGVILALPGLRDEALCECGRTTTLVPSRLDFSNIEIHSELLALETLDKRDFIKFP